MFTLAACAPDPQPSTTTQTPRIATAADFGAAIARLEQTDRQSPEAMNARLEYADFLLQSENGDCRTRLDEVREQLDALASRPALGVLLPLGPARLADSTYRIHAARAACDPQVFQSELQQALDSARKAADLYREALDYQSAAVMQFNVAATLRDLGKDEEAIAALQSVLAMDREFGFRDDARDNIRLLLRWQKQDPTDDSVAQAMKDFPVRTAEFKFGWSESDADVAVTAEGVNVVDENVIHSRGVNLIRRQVRRDGRNWAVSYEPGTPNYEMGDWSQKDDVWWFTAYALNNALLSYPKFEVRQTGDFENVRDPSAFGRSLSDDMIARLEGTSFQLKEQLRATAIWLQTLKSVFRPQYVEADVAQTYNVQTATWIGAKLEQGTWYRMSAPLLLPGLAMGKFLIAHDVEFSYTRQVPCETGAKDLSCVEIVVHATPDPKDLALAREDVAHSLHVSPQALRHWSTTSLRLVVRPDTLVPYASDTREYWYSALDGTGKDHTMISSERVVAVSRYH